MLVVSLLVPAVAAAQQTLDAGSVSGRMSDPSGAVIVGRAGHGSTARHQPGEFHRDR
jgi:hypothetical protein